MPDITFDLIISSTGAGYAIRAAAPMAVGELPEQSFELPFDLSKLSQKRKDAAEWVAQARIARRRGAEEQRLAREFGAALFERLFAGEILAGLRACRGRLRDDERLHLRLRLPPELAMLPWELLFDPHDDQFLALAPDLALLRYPELARPVRPLRVDGPLQVVAVLASPSDPDYPPIRLDRELRRIETALKPPIEQLRIALDVIRGPDTLGQLRARLRRPAHVLHVLSHGDLDTASGEGVLIFEDADGAAEAVGAELLRQQIQRQRGATRLVLLNACLGALPAGDDPFGSLGAALLRGGVPAVIAMQFELADNAAVELARVFYAELAAGAPVDIALTEARLHLYGRFRTRLDWAVPVLFMRAEDGVLFETAADGRRSTTDDRPPTVDARARQPTEPTLPRANQADSPVQIQSTTQAPLDPPALRSLWRSALAAYFTRRWEEAERLLAQIEAADASYEDVQARLAEARRQLRLLALYRQARELRDAGQWAAVLGALDELKAQQHDYPDPEGLRAWAESQRRREALYDRALAACDASDWTGALRELEQLLADFPDDTDAQALLAHARVEAEAQAGREAKDRAGREAAEHERAYRERFGLVQIQIQAGNHAQALDLLEALLQQQPANSEAVALIAGLIENPAGMIEQRLRAARLAGQYGDPRPGVCTLEPAWCGPFPAGEYPIADGKAHARLREFRVARYPVTVWRFRQFVEAKGYEDERWWTEQGKPLRNRLWPPYRWDNPDWTADNQPVVGVSWYEAAAFCRWLGARGRAEGWLGDDWEIRLPSEAEWEVAAMWDAQARQMRPWQPPANAIWQNVQEAGIGRTSPVGLFPQGASPCGALDMAGNVWEWCASRYDEYPAKAHQVYADLVRDQIGPTLRGGRYYLQNARSGWGARDGYFPYFQFVGRGFRVVACSAPPV
jgi:formylglycine-generating enzyme required for sulfatase activity